MNFMTFMLRDDENDAATSLTMQIDANQTWPIILQEFICFLRGAGFHITEEMIAEQYADYLDHHPAGPTFYGDNSY